eukprot:Rmarinus@m.19725
MNSIYVGDTKRDKVFVRGALKAPRHEVTYVYDGTSDFEVEYDLHSVIIFDTAEAGQDMEANLPACDISSEGQTFVLVNTGADYDVVAGSGTQGTYSGFPVGAGQAARITCICPSKTDPSGGSNRNECVDGRFVRIDSAASTTVSASQLATSSGGITLATTDDDSDVTLLLSSKGTGSDAMKIVV